LHELADLFLDRHPAEQPLHALVDGCQRLGGVTDQREEEDEKLFGSFHSQWMRHAEARFSLGYF
jgi:hypothetical protein